jgi:hypothetical protein
MRLFHALLTLLCVASALARHNTLLRRDGEDAAPAVNETDLDPKRFIIEFEDVCLLLTKLPRLPY